MSRDQRDSDDDWEEKEASRQHFVKFTDDASEAREVRLYCCNLIPMPNRKYIRVFKCNALSRSRYTTPLGFSRTTELARTNLRRSRNWLRKNVWEKFSKQRAYLAMSAFFVALE